MGCFGVDFGGFGSALGPPRGRQRHAGPGRVPEDHGREGRADLARGHGAAGVMAHA